MSRRYRRSRVRAIIIQEEDYFNKFKVQVIKFAELGEESRKSIKYYAESFIKTKEKSLHETESYRFCSLRILKL